MLKHRIIAAMIVIAVTYCGWYADARYGMGWGFAGVMALLTIGALREFYRMTRSQGWEPFTLFAYVMGVLLVFSTELWCLQKWHGMPRFSPDAITTLIGIAVMGTILLQLFCRGSKGAIGNVAGTLMGLIYVWYLPSFLIRMRHLDIPGNMNGWELDGVELVLVCIFVAKCSDVGGLLVGSQIGKHKLWPEVSPKKTWEGTFGGICFSVAIICWMAYCAPGSAVSAIELPKRILLGALLAVSSLIGDLVESAFKRDAQVKDAGASVPGFGGILDLVDSLMVSAPVMFFYLITVVGAKPGGE